MMVLRKSGHLFMSCPKTGTMSLYVALMECGGVRHGAWHEREAPRRGRPFNWIGAVRNPYSRATSLYSYLMFPPPERAWHGRRPRTFCGDDQSFESFAAWLATLTTRPSGAPELFASQSLWYRGKPIKTFLRTETLEDDFARLPFSGPIGRLPGKIPLPRINTSGSRSWEDLATPRALELVNRWAEPDFERFGYERLSQV